MKVKRFSKIEIVCIILIILSALLSFAGYFYFTYFEAPNIELKGEKEITLELNEKYKDYGAVATVRNGNISNNIKIKGKVNTSKVGDYKIIYYVTNEKGYRLRKIMRVVKVRDVVKPVLKLKGGSPYITSYGYDYKDPGYIAKDNYDGNITKKVKVKGKVNTEKIGSYKLVYSVTDSSLNTVTKVRIVKVVDNVAPTITLNDGKRIIIKLNTEYQEPGYEAIDKYDGNVTEDVYVSGKINTSVAGIYELSYSVSDSFGNYSKKTRIVQVGTRADIDEANYILISIKEQKLWYYKKGNLLLKSNVITGNKGSFDTVTGRFRIRSKAAGTYLVGDNYRSWVDYWMLFDPSTQSGLHDATWHSSFGGNIYETNGSHGCVNLPYSSAQKIYKNISVGTLVIIYK